MLNFPNAPTVGQVFGEYIWDGEKWGSAYSGVGEAPNDSKLYGRKNKLWSEVVADPTKLSVAGGQTITGGFNITPAGLSAGNITVNALLGNYQHMANSGAFTITAPTNDCAVDLLVTNSPTAGAITFTGFTVGANTGDLLTTTNGHRFILSIRRINAISTYVIKALQ
jgi:hypothetical protein